MWTMLGHKLRAGITVGRNYDRALPTVCADGSALNQVWTNRIENATDAVGSRGALPTVTRRDGGDAVVEIGEMVRAFPPRYKRASSSCSSPPGTWARTAAWASPSRTGSWWRSITVPSLYGRRPAIPL